VDTIRFGGQVIAGLLISSGPAAATNPFELTYATFALDLGKVSQLLKERGIIPNLSEAFLFHIPGFHIKIATSLHPTHMRYEAEPGTGQASPGKGIHRSRMSAVSFVRNRSSLF